MPDPVWHFCRTCGHRGRFVVGPDDAIEYAPKIECPECRKRYVVTIMVRQDVEWAKKEESQ